jgi:hypothetical protein
MVAAIAALSINRAKLAVDDAALTWTTEPGACRRT